MPTISGMPIGPFWHRSLVWPRLAASCVAERIPPSRQWQLPWKFAISRMADGTHRFFCVWLVAPELKQWSRSPYLELPSIMINLFWRG